MIGLDTNVIVRVLVRDTPAQSKLAIDVLASRTPEDPAFVSAIVLVELVWVLRRNFGYSSDAVYAAIQSLFESANVVVERAETIADAVQLAFEGGADIADCIIAAIATEAGATKTVTFDKTAPKRIPGMELLA